MPDNAIALGVNPPAAPANPLALAGQVLQTQNLLNQNAMFQQQFAAKQRAGQIMASAPDLESGWQALQTDPQTAPFAGEIVKNARESQLALIKMQGEQQTQAQSGLSAATKAMTGALADPSSFRSIMDAQIATMSPSAAQRVGPAIDALQTSLTHGLDGLPPAQARTVYNQRMIGLLTGSGVTPDEIHAIVGTPTSQDTGGGIVTGVQAPSQLGGGFQPGAVTGKTLAPQVVQGTGSEGQPVATVVGGGQGGTNPLVPGTSTSPSVSRGTASNPLIPPSPPGAVLIGPSATNSEYLKSRGKDMAQYQQDLDDVVRAGGVAMQTISEAKDALKQFTPGGYSSINAKVGQLAQEFGADPATVDKIANGDIAASQEFQKLMVNTTTSQMRQQMQGMTSHTTQKEFESFLDANPNINTDPKAIDKIFGFWQKMYGRSRTEQSALTEHLKSGGDISEWPSQWQTQMQEKGWTPSNTESSPGGGVTHHYVPGQGIVPVH